MSSTNSNLRKNLIKQSRKKNNSLGSSSSNSSASSSRRSTPNTSLKTPVTQTPTDDNDTKTTDISELPVENKTSSHIGLLANTTVIARHPDVKYDEFCIDANFQHRYNTVEIDHGHNRVFVQPNVDTYSFRTRRRVSKLGVLVVGLAGNNGSTLIGSLLAHKHNLNWKRRGKLLKPNYYGSITQSSTVRIGTDSSGNHVHAPLKTLLPLVNPTDMIIHGWDICGHDLATSMEEAEVFDQDLQRQLKKHMKQITAMPAVYKPAFSASVLAERANNVLPMTWTNEQYVKKIREDIKKFREENDVDQIIVLWSASTERYVVENPKIHDTVAGITDAIRENYAEISPSQLYAIAAIKEHCSFLNASPQNTLVPGIIKLAEEHNVFIGGSDAATGQTAQKCAIADFLTSRAFKMQAIYSVNSIGNGDAKCLNEPAQFKSKQISKSGIVEDMVAANSILYPTVDGVKEKPDHVVKIDYVPYVKDDKRAIDEYSSTIFMNGDNNMLVYVPCRDSLLFVPVVLDAILLTELATRISYKGKDVTHFKPLGSLLHILSVFWKAPVTDNMPVVNSFFKKLRNLTNFLCACLGLATDDDLMLS